MNHLWRCGFIFIVLVIIIPVSCAKSRHDLMNDENESLPSDFVDFVKSLDKMVFNNNNHQKNKTETDATTKRRRRTQTTKNMKLRKSNNLKSSQNSALRDILMLKLVSYYEDKYKVSQDSDYTTVRSLEPLYRASAQAAEPTEEVRSVGSPLLTDDTDKPMFFMDRRKNWYPDTTKYRQASNGNTQSQRTPDPKPMFADVVVL